MFQNFVWCQSKLMYSSDKLCIYKSQVTRMIPLSQPCGKGIYKSLLGLDLWTHKAVILPLSQEHGT